MKRIFLAIVLVLAGVSPALADMPLPTAPYTPVYENYPSIFPVPDTIVPCGTSGCNITFTNTGTLAQIQTALRSADSVMQQYQAAMQQYQQAQQLFYDAESLKGLQFSAVPQQLNQMYADAYGVDPRIGYDAQIADVLDQSSGTAAQLQGLALSFSSAQGRNGFLQVGAQASMQTANEVQALTVLTAQKAASDQQGNAQAKSNLSAGFDAYGDPSSGWDI